MNPVASTVRTPTEHEQCRVNQKARGLGKRTLEPVPAEHASHCQDARRSCPLVVVGQGPLLAPDVTTPAPQLFASLTSHGTWRSGLIDLRTTHFGLHQIAANQPGSAGRKSYGMDHFVFSDDLLTGVPQVDAQHRMLFRLANQVVDPEPLERDANGVLVVVNFLSGYIDYHFAAEEYVMRETRYPRYELHCHWHETFRAEVRGIVRTARTEGITKSLVRKVSYAIQNWLFDHIRTTDRELAKFLLAQANSREIKLPSPRELRDAGAIPQDIVMPELD